MFIILLVIHCKTLDATTNIVCWCVCVCSYVAGDGVEEAPLEEDEEDQPAKDAQQEQHLRHKLQYNVQIVLEVAAEYKNTEDG